MVFLKFLLHDEIDRKNGDLFFFITLFALIFLCYLSGVSQCMYFFINFERNLTSVVFFRILFIFACFFHLFNPNFGSSLVKIFSFKPVVLYCKKFMGITMDFLKTQPLLSTLLIFSYFSFLVVRFFLLIFVGMDPVFEFIYQTFNFIRLIIFPVFIYSFVITNLQNYFPEDSLKMEHLTDTFLNSAQGRQFLENFVENVKLNAQKHPKMTKGVGILSFLTGAITGFGLLKKKNFREMQESTQSTSQNFLNILKNHGSLDETKEREILQELLQFELWLSRSGFRIGVDSVNGFFTAHPNSLKEFSKLVSKYKDLEFSIILDDFNKKQAASVVENLSGTTASRSLSPRVVEGRSSRISHDPVSTVTTNPLQDNELASSSQIITAKPKANSIIEESFWF